MPFRYLLLFISGAFKKDKNKYGAQHSTGSFKGSAILIFPKLDGRLSLGVAHSLKACKKLGYYIASLNTHSYHHT
jgi:hypothetical protein